jgi:hypothetical protein
MASPALDVLENAKREKRTKKAKNDVFENIMISI